MGRKSCTEESSESRVTPSVSEGSERAGGTRVERSCGLTFGMTTLTFTHFFGGPPEGAGDADNLRRPSAQVPRSGSG